MEKRILPGTDLNLTPIGLGTWAIGGPWDWGWGAQDERDSVRTIHRALELGINWIDTAPCYGLGHAERVIGKALADRRVRPAIATKCGQVWDAAASGTVYGSLKRASVQREAEASLRRLGVEVIDLYQIHWPTPEEEIEEAWEAMAQLVAAGKVRHIGVSNFSVSQMERLQAIHPIATLQPPYSMLERGIEADILPYCEAQGIGLLAYSPMQAGLLTGGFNRDRRDQLEPGDWRREDPHFQEPLFSRHLKTVNRLRPIAERNGLSLAQLALVWALREGGADVAIAGARRPNQIEETVVAASRQIAPEDLEDIELVLRRTPSA